MLANTQVLAPWWKRLHLPLLCVLSLGLMFLSPVVYHIETGVSGGPAGPLTYTWIYLFMAPVMVVRYFGLRTLEPFTFLTTPLFYGVLWWSAWQAYRLMFVHKQAE